jgi:hypothetical protein
MTSQQCWPESRKICTQASLNELYHSEVMKAQTILKHAIRHLPCEHQQKEAISKSSLYNNTYFPLPYSEIHMDSSHNVKGLHLLMSQNKYSAHDSLCMNPMENGNLIFHDCGCSRRILEGTIK